MKSKYLFSFSTRPIDDSTLFVDVWIGTSRQDQRDYEFFLGLAQNSTNYLFQRYDIATTQYLQSVDVDLQDQLGDPRARHLSCSMSAAKLRRLIKSGLYDDWANTYYFGTRAARRRNLCDNSAYWLALYRADTTIANPPTK